MGRLLAAVACFVLAGAPARADEPAPRPPAPAPPEAEAAPALVLLGAAEASPLAEGLRKAMRADPPAALAALGAVAGKTHPSFDGPLTKLLAHESSEVASRAVDALVARAGPKTAATLWRSGWQSPANRDRAVVRAAVLRGLGRLGAPLDEKQYEEVVSLWRRATSGAVRVDVAGYFAARKVDKRPCRLLAEALDEPIAPAVDDGSSPPASVWEERWKAWRASKPAIQEALHAITGQTFETSAEAKAWFQKNAKEFGFAW